MRLNMQTTMSREDLIKKLEENRARHEGEHGEAVEAFWVKAQAFAEKTLERVTARDSAFLKLAASGHGYGMAQIQAVAGVLGFGGDKAMPAPPSCHLKDYDQALGMVRAHTGDSVQLDAEDYARLVDDNWEWTGSFRSSYNLLTG